jgi:hypothetical protein
MNAYELAKYLEIIKVGFTTQNVCLQSATMLRVQAEKIADLQTTISFLESECKALRGQANELQ